MKKLLIVCVGFLVVVVKNSVHAIVWEGYVKYLRGKKCDKVTRKLKAFNAGKIYGEF